MRASSIIHVVSCHAAGEVGDVIVGGVAPPPGETLWQQSRWIARDGRLREFILNEPRGGVFRHVNLERGLLVGLGLLATGLVLSFWLLSAWWGQSMGPLEVQTTMRYALWGLTTIVLGVQTIFGSFFLSMLGMSEKAQEARKKLAQAA